MLYGDEEQRRQNPDAAFVCGDPAADRIYIGYPADDIFGLPKKGRHNFVVTYLIILFTYLFVFFSRKFLARSATGRFSTKI